MMFSSSLVEEEDNELIVQRKMIFIILAYLMMYMLLELLLWLSLITGTAFGFALCIQQELNAIVWDSSMPVGIPE